MRNKSIKTINEKITKGKTFDRVIIYPTEDMKIDRLNQK